MTSRLELAEFPSEQTLFYLLPIYKHQTHRDNMVFFREEFHIVSHMRFLNESLYLHVSRSSVDSQITEEVDNLNYHRKMTDKVARRDPVRAKSKLQ